MVYIEKEGKTKVKLNTMLPLLLIMMALAAPAFAATGDEDLLCSAISEDLSTAGGCVDEDGFEDATTSALSIGMLEVGDSSGLLVLMFIIAVIAAVLTGAVIKFTSVGKKVLP